MEVNFRRKLSAFAAIFGMLVVLSIPALAQTPLGRIAGVVTDASGAVVPNAKVTATNEDTKQTLTTTSSNSGGFNFVQVPVGFYTVKIEAAGMKTKSYSKVKVDTGLEYSITAQLEVGAQSETVEVVAGAELVNTSTSEISNTVNKEQIRDLPLASRNPIELIKLQAGIPGVANRTATAINGARPGWTQVTQDGINIQDNFIRVNGLDFVPNRPTSDNIGEFTISTNQLGADAAGGSSQVKLSTEGGTNAYHGSLYEFNRNYKFAANSWSNNNATLTCTATNVVDPNSKCFGQTTVTPNNFVSNKIPKPFLNRNQFGGRIGGPILKNKLFFFGYYEKFWEVRQVSASKTVPLYDQLFQGEYHYVDSGGVTRSVNVMTMAGMNTTRNVTGGTTTTPARPIDPSVQSFIISKVPSASTVTNVGTSLLTGTAQFNQSDQVKRDFIGGRVDYEFNQSNHLEFIYKRSVDTDLRTDLDTINANPNVDTYATTDFYAAAWRWTINPRMQNEFRAGGNLAPVAFRTFEDYAAFGGRIYGGIPFISNPEVTFQTQGRDTRTYDYIDTFSWTRGNHSMTFGGQFQNVRVQPFNAAGPDLFPQWNFGYATTLPCPAGGTCEFLGGGNFPTAVSATTVNNANALRAFLSGVISSANQTFEVKDKTSGFVPNLVNVRDFTLNTWSVYAKDSWRVRPNITLNYGLKWEYWTPLKEDNGLMLEPVLNGRTAAAAVLDPATKLDFTKGQMWNKDLNNFGPTFGFAWDPWSNGKTSVRGGYTMTFVNEEMLTVARNALNNNAGLQSARSVINQFVTFNNPSIAPAGGPTVPTPAFVIPRTQADQMALTTTAAIFGIEPDIQTPYVHQLNLSIQRELPGDFAVEARYVGTLGRKLWRVFDLNQQKAGVDAAFLAEFALARQNIFTAGCGAVTGTGCPNAASSMPIITGFGFTTNSLITTPIVQNAPGALADVYVGNLLTGPGGLSYTRFLNNTGIYVADIVRNGSTLGYHGLQLEARRRMKNGVFGQVNYTWSKGLTDTSGDNQTRVEALLDNARPELERRVSDFNVYHVINGNLIYELPFGQGKRWGNDNKILNYVIGGWQVGSILHWQTGAPMSIFSQRGTFNRAGRSGFNTANSILSRGQIQDLFGIFRCGEGGVVCPTGVRNGTMYWINPSITGTTGAAVGPDNLANTPSTAFNQIFSHPTAGQVGTLGINAFTGPSQFTWDFSMGKKTKITERFNLEFRSEFFNFTNHTNWFVSGTSATQNLGDGSTTGNTFGRLSPGSVNVSERVIQFALKLNF